MEVTIVSKIKLDVDEKTDALLSETSKAYIAACNYASEYAFDNDVMTKVSALHDAVYSHLRSVYNLKAQMACSVSRTVAAKYKTLKEQLKQNPFSMKENGKTYRCKRNLGWLEEPVRFDSMFVDLVRNRDYSLCKEGLSINTLDKRVKVSYESYNFEYLVDSGWQMGAATLIKRKGMWYLLVPLTKEFEDIESFKKITGIDRGLRFVMASYDGKKTVFYSGEEIAKKREKYARTRASLQSRGTKGAKRVLKRISGRENRWMSDVNHCLSKTLVLENGPGTLFVLEDLKDISTDERNFHKKEQKRELRSWSFYDLEQKVAYKAKENGCGVIKVPAAYTSQRCPVCGYIDKSNRDRKKHLFCCKKCGYRSNDDRVGAMNLNELGIRYLKTGELKGFSRQ